MGKSKNRKKPNKSRGQEYTSQTNSKTNNNFLSLIDRFQKHPVMYILGILFSIITFSYTKLFHELEILNTTAPIDEPFSIKFSILNSNLLGDANISKIICNVTDVKYTNPTIISTGNKIINNNKIVIESGETGLYPCSYDHVLQLNVPITQASLTISLEYNQIGILNRRTDSEIFNWDNKSKQWQKGKLIY